MQTISEHNNPSISFLFECKNHKQKMLIDALLRYSKITLYNLATMLEIPEEELQESWRGERFLTPENALTLAGLFLICFSD